MSAREQARRGNFPLGEPSIEMLLQEWFSLKNTKEMFRKPDWNWHVSRIEKALQAKTGQSDPQVWADMWHAKFRGGRGSSSHYERAIPSKETKKKDD